MDKPILDIQNLTKTYYIGTFGRDTLTAELQSFYARLRGKEDPNLKIGKVQHAKGSRFNALNDVSFNVQQGEAVGIIGHNGAGILQFDPVSQGGEVVRRGGRNDAVHHGRRERAFCFHPRQQFRAVALDILGHQAFKLAAVVCQVVARKQGQPRQARCAAQLQGG